MDVIREVKARRDATALFELLRRKEIVPLTGQGPNFTEESVASTTWPPQGLTSPRATASSAASALVETSIFS
jgi:hypothetical protein